MPLPKREILRRVWTMGRPIAFDELEEIGESDGGSPRRGCRGWQFLQVMCTLRRLPEEFACADNPCPGRDSMKISFRLLFPRLHALGKLDRKVDRLIDLNDDAVRGREHLKSFKLLSGLIDLENALEAKAKRSSVKRRSDRKKPSYVGTPICTAA